MLCKEGNEIETEAWASIWRSQTGALVCSGLPGRFMSQTIPDKVREWLAFEGHKKLDRPLELWIRRGGEWNARDLAARSVSAAARHPSGSRGRR